MTAFRAPENCDRATNQTVSKIIGWNKNLILINKLPLPPDATTMHSRTHLSLLCSTAHY